MKALLISADPKLRETLRVSLGAVERGASEPWMYLEAADGLEGIRLAWRELPDVVVADEIASRAGAFAVVKELKGARDPLAGIIVVVLARKQDEWLAEWSGADAWFVKPVDPFALADTVVSLLERQERTHAEGAIS